MKDAILIADDMEVNRTMLAQLFSNDYDILEAENGESALELLSREDLSIALVLLDISMPVMDGYEVLQALNRRGLLQKFPVVVLTSEESAGSAVLPFDLGAADIIACPFEPYIVKRRMRNIIDLYRHKNSLERVVADQAKNLQISNESMIDALSSVIEYRSMESGQHIRRIRMFTKILLRNVAEAFPGYNLDERKINIVASASAMHDIGKIAIPDSILNKPGPLTPDEFEVMKTHSLRGCEIIRGIGWMDNREYLNYAYNICRYHHERWDGRGYPDGIQGNNIPLCAQVVGLADAYDALTTHRVYKEAYPHETAFRMILNGECGSFSPRLLECFQNVREAFEGLALAYHDGRSPNEETFHTPPASVGYDPGSTQYGQLKYYAILKFLDATVLELDLDQSVVRVAYKTNNLFSPTGAEQPLEEMFASFTAQSVCPEDRELMQSCLRGSLQEVLERGESGHFWECRVWSAATSEYRWHLATVLKIDTGTPRLHRALLVLEDIHSTKTAVQQHNAEERQYHSALCSTYSATFSVDVEHNRYSMIRAEDSRFSWDGLPSGYLESAQKLAREVVFPEDREDFLAALSKARLLALTPGQKQAIEYRRLDNNGEYRWVDMSFVRSDDPECMDPVVYVFVRDIDSQKQMEWKTNRAELRLKTALQDYFSSVIELNLTTSRYTMLKPMREAPDFPESGGLSDLNAFSRKYIYPDDLVRLTNYFNSGNFHNAFLAGTGRITQEYRAVLRDGRLRRYEAVFARETSGSSDDMLVLVFLQSVSRPAVYAPVPTPVASAAASSLQLAALLANAPGGIARFALDEEFSILEATDGFFTLTGYTREEFFQPPLEGRSLRVIVTTGQTDPLTLVRKKLMDESFVCLEFPIRKKDGSIVRIRNTTQATLLEDGSLVGLGVFTAVGATHVVDPRPDEQNYLSLIHQFNDILFEYDLTNRTCHYSENFISKFGFEPPSTMDQMVALSSSNIHEDDLGAYLEAISMLGQPKQNPYWETEYRFRDITGEFCWCWERAFILTGQDGQPYKVVGIISDVGRYKLQNELLEARANTDQLTGLYNKVTTERLIRSALADSVGDALHALFVIDIDDFKLVNDSSGHLMGDEVLKKISNRILSQFRKHDIVGRIGGDEFVVLLRDVPDHSLISKKACSLLEALRELFADIDQRRYISASVGVSVYPHDGKRYQDLFERADAALYAAKRGGKEQWRMFSPNLHTLHGPSLPPLRTNRIEGALAASSGDFVTQALHVLFEVEDEDESVRAVLDMAARRYSLDRIFVYELDGGVRQLFEWSASSAARHHSHSSPAELCRTLEEMHPDGSPFVCDDLLAASEARSRFLAQELNCTALLQAPVYDGGRLFGVAGFSDKNGLRRWTQDEIDACRFLARTVAMFYTRKRAGELLELTNSVNATLMNQIGSASLVVDESFVIRSSSVSLDRRFGPCAGNKCYVLLQRRGTPCPDCPIRSLSKSTVTASCTMHLRALEASYLVQATRMKWDRQQNAFLLALHETAERQP